MGVIAVLRDFGARTGAFALARGVVQNFGPIKDLVHPQGIGDRVQRSFC